jgi:hypothetical protein
MKKLQNGWVSISTVDRVQNDAQMSVTGGPLVDTCDNKNIHQT